MKKSAKELQAFLQKNYIDNPSMGSPDMSAAIRDLLTDLYRVSEGVTYLQSRLEDANNVYREEIGLYEL